MAIALLALPLFALLEPVVIEVAQVGELAIQWGIVCTVTGVAIGSEGQSFADIGFRRPSWLDSVTADWFASLDLPELSGADIAAICRKALEFTVAEFDSGDREPLTVTRADIQNAVKGLRTNSNTDDRHGFR
jgi:hypothetical protein